MDPTLAIVLGLVALAAVGLLADSARRRARRSGLGPGDTVAASDATAGPTLMRPSRIVVVGDRRPLNGSRPAASGFAGRVGDPRRRLVRDASAVLLVAAAAVLLATNLPAFGGSGGGVLSVAATPEAAVLTPARAPAPDASSGTGVALDAGTSINPAGAEPSVAAVASTAETPLAPLGTPSVASLDQLRPCADRSDCYVYVVARGDNLTRIARRFGVPVDTIVRLNPQIRDPSLIVAGERITLPTPTR